MTKPLAPPNPKLPMYDANDRTIGGQPVQSLLEVYRVAGLVPPHPIVSQSLQSILARHSERWREEIATALEKRAQRRRWWRWWRGR